VYFWGYLEVERSVRQGYALVLKVNVFDWIFPRINSDIIRIVNLKTDRNDMESTNSGKIRL
jgi:hypothetical protein